MQLASTFTEFINNKIPANVEMVKKSYDNMIKVKVIPDELMNKVKAMFGIPTKIQQPDSEKPEGEAKRRQLQNVSKEQVKKNQITLGVFLMLLVVAIIVIIVLRRKIWARFP